MGNCGSASHGRVQNDSIRENGNAKVEIEPLQDNLNTEVEANEQISYPTFAAFFLSAENPQIFEYQFLNEIGKGAMSRVFLVKNVESDEICAAKVYNTLQLLKQTLGVNETMLDQVNKEIDIMAKLANPYLLSLIEVVEDDATNSIIIFMPYARGSLQTLLNQNSIDDQQLSICFYQTAEGLRFLHSKNIVHRDIKPENILEFNKNYFVLSDFSVSTELQSENELLEDTKGSPAFLSPEECSGDPFDGKCADVWAYGVSLYQSLYGMLPFDLDSGQSCSIANTVFHVTQMLAEKTLEFPENRPIPDNLKELLIGTLDKNPKTRLTFEQIITSSWFDEAKKIEEQTQNEEEEEVIEN